MKIGKLVFRVVVGGLFIGHGMQKLTGAFGGSGLEGTDTMMDNLDMHPPRRNALAVGVTETAGGAMVMTGLATPLAAAGLIGSMVTAVRKVHWKNGPWNSNGGWELNAIIIAGLTALVEGGPGKISMDALAGRKKWGTGWALGALAAGVVGSAAMVELGRWEARKAEGEPDAGSAGAGAGAAGADAGSGAGPEVHSSAS